VHAALALNAVTPAACVLSGRTPLRAQRAEHAAVLGLGRPVFRRTSAIQDWVRHIADVSHPILAAASKRGPPRRLAPADVLRLRQHGFHRPRPGQPRVAGLVATGAAALPRLGSVVAPVLEQQIVPSGDLRTKIVQGWSKLRGLAQHFS
jgi:hypothetical protein